MINAVMTIGGHLTNRIMCDERGAAISLPNLYPSLYQFRLKIIDRGPDGKPFQAYPKITSLGASIGLVYAEPRAGTFKLRYGTSTATEAIDFKEPAESFREKLAALTGSTTYGLDVLYQPTPSTWVMRFTDDTFPIPLNGVENELEPETFIRVRQYIQNSENWVEVRLLQGPVASTNAHDIILAAPPSVRTIRDGSIEGDIFSTIIITEIQAIYVPPDFTGTYTLKFQGRHTVPLSATDGSQAIQDALNHMFTDGKIRFTVTNPQANNAYVEFVGVLAGANVDPLIVVVTDDTADKPDQFFELDLNTVEVADALRANATAAARFELRIHIVDPSVVGDPGQDLVLFNEPVTLVRPLHWEGLESAAPINWLYPPNPKDYIPFTHDQVIVGDLSYAIAFGDGIANNFSIAHDLNSEALSVTVRENVAGGRQLDDDEYDVTFDNANGLTINVPGTPPATDALLVIIHASGPVSAFLNHTHEIEQINGLPALLDDILQRLGTLETVLPTIISSIPGTSPFGTSSDETILTVVVEDKFDMVPTNRPPTAATTDVSKLPQSGLLLPAVHDVIALGGFTVNTGTNDVTLSTAHAGLVAGQRARIDVPLFYLVGTCTFEADTDTITTTAPHGLVNGRQVKFSGGILAEPLSPNVIYFVINATSTTFQVATIAGGTLIALLDDGDAATHSFYTVSEIPAGLSPGVDYFMLAPTSTVFKLAATIGGAAIDITSVGFPPYTISSVDEQPSLVAGLLPPPASYAGNAYSVRQDIYLPGGRGIRSETVHAGDLIASDGRVWYHVTRSDAPGSNSFYPNPMELELFRLTINEQMFLVGSVFTLKFDLEMRMYKQDCNVQYLLVIEIGQVPPETAPSPVGPNLFAVEWSTTPLMQQRIIVTNTLITHHFGAQVVRKATGEIVSNKKQYATELAGDNAPTDPNFAIRVRLVEFDTENNINDASGLVYYKFTKGEASITRSTPVTPGAPTVVPP